MFHIVDHKDEGRAQIGGAQVIARASLILRLLAQAEPQGLSLGKVAAQAALTKPTARRILRALIESGLVQQDMSDKEYHLGFELYALGLAAQTRFGVQHYAGPSLMRLADWTGDAAFLTVRRGTHTLCLVREEGAFPIRSHVLQAGDRHVFGVGAAAIAMLGAMPAAEADALIAACADRLEAAYPRLSADKVRALVADAREAGYGLNPGLVFEGSWGVAVALRNPLGEVVAALTLSAIEVRLREPSQQQAYAQLLQREAQLIEKAMHAPPPTMT